MLSKSRVIAGRQCPRRLWLEVNRPELRVYDGRAQRRFAQGHQLDALVRRLHPEGILIDGRMPPASALQHTAAHLAEDPARPLFEAAFSSHGVLVRADIFAKVGAGFHLTEVKSSTRVRPGHLIDCAIQAWVITAAGYPVDRTILAHIDTRFVYRGDGDYTGLLRHVDVGERIADLLPEVAGWVEAGLATLLLREEPQIAVGRQCSDPYPCPFMDHCRPPAAEYPVGLLPGGGRVIAELQAEGIEDVRDIPPGRLHKPLQQRVHQATLSGTPYIAAELGATLRALPYPRHYLDFEAIQFAIPRWPDTRPYEQLPFQWSCHTEPNAGELVHHEFLDTSGQPPLRRCAETLLETLRGDGPILTYSRFERDVMNRLAARFPDLAAGLRALNGRLLDLLPLVRTHYYHPAMKGSFSIKAVLPTISPRLGYHALGEVRDGIAAQVAYETIIDPMTTPARRATLSDELRDYCRLDTLAMVELVRFFSAR